MFSEKFIGSVNTIPVPLTPEPWKPNQEIFNAILPQHQSNCYLITDIFFFVRNLLLHHLIHGSLYIYQGNTQRVRNCLVLFITFWSRIICFHLIAFQVQALQKQPTHFCHPYPALLKAKGRKGVEKDAELC